MNGGGVVLLEFDDRFAVFGPKSFVKYDYSQPLDLPPSLRARAGTFDVVFADPPFLSEECMGKTAETVRLLARPATEGGRVIMCTGYMMRLLVARNLGIFTQTFRPVHHGNLANPFRCYSNFACAALGGADAEEEEDVRAELGLPAESGEEEGGAAASRR